MSENRGASGERKEGLVLYPKIYVDPHREVDEWFRNNRASIVEKLKKLPSDNLSIYAEPRVRALYGQTYMIFTLGFNNATIVMCGILLEAMLKEVIYFKENRDFSEIVGIRKADFGHAIAFCKKKGYITKDEAKILRKLKDEIRNPYLHSNVERIAKDKGVLGWEIGHTSPKELLDKVRLIAEGKLKLPEGKIMTVENLRVVGDIVKGIVDEQTALPLFLEVDGFVRMMIKRHFESKDARARGE